MNGRFDEFLELVGDYEREYRTLLALINSDEMKRQKTVLSHNDLNLGNIIYDAERKKVTFIDFEGSTFAYQAWDIALHFTQFGGNYGKGVRYQEHLFPDEALQKKWLRHYLSTYLQINESKAVDEEELEREIEILYRRVCKLVLVAQFREALLMAACEVDDYMPDSGCLEMALDRMNFYWKNKSRLLSV